MMRRSEVGLTTTRHCEVTSPTSVIRQRQRHYIGQQLPSSRRDPINAAQTTRSSASLPRLGRNQKTYAEEPDQQFPSVHQRASSTLPVPRRAQLGIIVDRPPRLHHSTPPYRQCDQLSHHHRHHQHQQQQQQQQQQRRRPWQHQTVMTVDGPRRDDQLDWTAFSRTSTLQSDNRRTTTDHSTTTSTISQGYFTDCESSPKQSRHHQREPRRIRRRLPYQPAAASSQSHSKPLQRSSSTSRCRQEFRGLTPSPTAHGKTECGGCSNPPYSWTFPSRAFTESRDHRTSTVNNYDDALSSRAKRPGDPPYSTWTAGCSSRRSRSTTNSITNFDEQPFPSRRLAWRLQTPHGTLLLRSSRWSEASLSPPTATISETKRSSSLSSENDWRRTSADGNWLTVPRLQSRHRSTASDGRWAHSLPASFRLARRRSRSTSEWELSLEPIGRGIKTLECEQCYLAATAHLFTGR